MWGVAVAAFSVASVVTIFVTELVRSIVDRQRRRATGYGGTQDIAIAGVLIELACVLGAVICGVLWGLGR